jgi:WD40 repeat protein
MVRSHDGSRFVTLDATQHALIWDLDTGPRPILAEEVHHVAASADGTHVATATAQGVWMWDAATGIGKQIVNVPVKAVAVSSDGARLAVATPAGEVAVFTGTNLDWLIPLDREMFGQLAFSPDGRWLVAGGNTGKVRVFDLALRGIRAFVGHAGTVTRLVFDRDGGRLASTAMDHTVRVWSLADGTSLELRGHTNDVTSIEFAGDRLLTASTDRTARVWDLHSGVSRPLGRHSDRVVYAGVAPNGQLLTIDHDDRHVVYPDDLPADEAGLRAWLARWARGD